MNAISRSEFDSFVLIQASPKGSAMLPHNAASFSAETCQHQSASSPRKHSSLLSCLDEQVPHAGTRCALQAVAGLSHASFGQCHCRDNVPDPEEQLEDMQLELAGRNEKIGELEAYIANIMRDGVSNDVVLKELHDAMAVKDSAIAELQAYIDSELREESQSVEEDLGSAPAAGSRAWGSAESAAAEDDSDEPKSLSYGQTTLKINQLKAQIHRLESCLDSSSSETSSEEQDEIAAEAGVQKSWWSAKADSLTAEVVRLQTESAEAEERHALALQVRLACSHQHRTIVWRVWSGYMLCSILNQYSQPVLTMLPKQFSENHYRVAQVSVSQRSASPRASHKCTVVTMQYSCRQSMFWPQEAV